VTDPPVTSSRQVLGRLAGPVYLPWIAMGFGTAMLAPTLPLYLSDADFSDSRIGLVLAAAGVGAALAALPTGGLIERIGTRAVIALWLAVLGTAIAALGLTTTLIALLAFRFVGGAAEIAIRLGGQTEITRRVPVTVRGRAMSFMGGGRRLTFFIGPIVGGVLADAIGFEATFVVAGIVIACGALPAIIGGRARLVPTSASTRTASTMAGSKPSIRSALRPHRRLLAMATFGPLLIMAAREGRFLVLPRIGDELGLTPTMVGLVIAIGTGADLLLFPVAGWLMDRFGRLFAIIPAFTLMGFGLLLLGLAGSAVAVAIAGGVIGLGNGLSAGTMLTYGSDLAPPEATGPFLGAFAAVQDVGKVVGPLAVGVVADGASLGTASIVLAALLFVAIGWMYGVVGETKHRAA